MDWSDFKSEIQRRLQDDNVSDLIPGWYRSAATQFDARSEWRSLDRRQIIPTVAPYSTGTLTATNGSAVVTLSGGTFPSGAAGQLLAFTSDGTYYDISTRDGDTQVTLTSNYIGTTGSSKAFVLYSYALTPPTGFDPTRLYSITLQGGSSRFELVDYATDLEAFEDTPDETLGSGTPALFRVYHDKVLLVPPPDAVYNTLWLWKTKPTLPDTDSADYTLEWAAEEIEVLILWVWEIGLLYLNNGAAAGVRAQRMEALAAAITKNNHIPGRSRMRRVTMLRGGGGPRPAGIGTPIG